MVAAIFSNPRTASGPHNKSNILSDPRLRATDDAGKDDSVLA
jgi:hypothetical protein